MSQRSDGRRIGSTSSTHHVQAETNPPEPETFTKSSFVATLDTIRRLKYGGAVISMVVEPGWIEECLRLWHANTLVSVNIEPWQPYGEDAWMEDNDF